MTAIGAFSLAISLAIGVYLVVALLWPEKFD
jgi:K+-transporting ATPase KdpF subunit